MIKGKDKSRNIVASSNVTLLVPGMLSAGVQEQDNDRAREEQQTAAAQSRHCSLDSADRRAASASTVTQLHCTVDICRFIELPRPPSAPLQQNTETHIPAQPSPATSTSTRNFLVRFLDRVART